MKIKKFVVKTLSWCFFVTILVIAILLGRITVDIVQQIIWARHNCVTLGSRVVNMENVTICKNGIKDETFTYSLDEDETLKLKINVKKKAINSNY